MDDNTQKKAGMNPMMIVGIVVVLLIVGAVVVMGMQGNNQADTSNTPDATMEDEMEDDSMMMDDTNGAEGDDHMDGEDAMMMEGSIEVEGGAFYYDPNEIRVSVGEEVTIVLNSVDMQHDFVIDELDVRTEIIPGGESTSVTFTPTEAGEYEFYCSVGSHRAQGMVGTLIVE